MMDTILVQARWDAEAEVWTALSNDVPGLVIEAAIWTASISDTKLILPDLLELNGRSTGEVSTTFRAEEHLDLVS